MMTKMNPTNKCYRIQSEAILIIMVLSMMLQVEKLVVCGEGEARKRCIEKERHALLQFKAAAVDDFDMLSSWDGQNNLTDCCNWKGVRCSNRTGHVQSLNLHGTLSDDSLFLRFKKIPTSLVELHHLRYLELGHNDFEGTYIPKFLGSLTNLRYLDLSSCFFIGNIPRQLGSLPHLKHLDLSTNQLEGSIPHQLGNLSELQFLDLGSNHLQGTIPSQLGNLSSLQELYLGPNDVGGLKIGGVQWLANLTSLTHLDLTFLDLTYVMNLTKSHNWMQIISNLSKLEKLILSGCSISDLSLSHHSNFKFSSSLTHLVLSHNSFTSPVVFQWLSNVTSNLIHLDLTGNNLHGSSIIADHFGTTMKSLEQLYLGNNYFKGGDLNSFTNICTLSDLRVDLNNLTEDLPSILHNLSVGCAGHSLQLLDVSSNQITGSLPDLSMFSSLKTLDLSENLLKGKIPESIGLPPQIEFLNIELNSLEGGIPKSFGNTCTLISLYMLDNSLSEELPIIILHLSGCATYSLQNLHLDRNKINGTLPDMSIFPSLRELSLSGNRLTGKILEDFQLPSDLESLEINSNSLEGVINGSHFANLSKLKVLDLSGNSLVLTFGLNWIPPFQLEVMNLGHCKLGPYFPKWLKTQSSLTQLDISDAGISDTIPDWFWAQSTDLQRINISYNNLTGIIPNLSLSLTDYPSISLATNQFEGPIPVFLRTAESVDLSNNKFSDFVLFLCGNGTADRLGRLDISNNNLSGRIPDCWNKFLSLAYLDLSNNKFSGQVPTSIGSALELLVLILRNNSLTGELPFSLRNCTKLVMLDVGENRLSGFIPSWIGSSLQQLEMLSLRRNQFSGSLPSSLCYSTKIQLLDLSSNSLDRHIPKCFENFTAMTREGVSVNPVYADHMFIVNHTFGEQYGYSYDLITLFMWKGTEQIFKNDKLLLKGIDLSSNQLSGEIPAQLGTLVALVSLNLSRNNLTGQIPVEIGRLKSLDFLDLSRNHLFGSIPSSLAEIDRLSTLDLSHNNLSGKIPTGTQLQSFNASSYEENQDLWGPPLETICLGEEPHQQPTVKIEEDENDHFFQALYMSMGLGFFVGFWGIFGTILFNRSWRHTYFRFLNNLMVKFLSWWQ